MPTNTITPLPTPPNKASDTVNEFTSKADAFVAALPDLGVEANALAVELEGMADDAIASAAAAYADRVLAEEAAVSAVIAPGTNATSTTSLTIGMGTKNLTVQLDKLFVVGMSVKIASTASPQNWMAGDITSYNSGTGALVVDVTAVRGSGTFAAWTTSVSGGILQSIWVEWGVTTSSLTAANGEGWLVDTSGAVKTITLPVTPSVGDSVGVGDLSASFATNNCTIARNGNRIMGLTEDLVLNVNNQITILVYANATQGWKIVYAVPVGGVTQPFQLFQVQHLEAGGTPAANTVAATTQTRKLTNEILTEVPGASLDTVNYRVTLPAGTYEVDIRATTHGAVGATHLRLYNYTDGVYPLIGVNTSGAGTCHLQGAFSITATKVFEVRHYTQSGVTNGFGIACTSGSPEKYVDAIFKRRTA